MRIMFRIVYIVVCVCELTPGSHAACKLCEVQSWSSVDGDWWWGRCR